MGPLPHARNGVLQMGGDQTRRREKPQQNQDSAAGVFAARRRPLLSPGLDECRHVFGPDLVKVRIPFAKDRPQQSVGEAEVSFSGTESDTGHALQMLVESLQPVFHAPGSGWHSLYLRGHRTLATKQLD